MFEAYSIGIRVSLINGVTTGLLGMARLFRTTDQDAKGLQKTMERIGKLAAVGTALSVTGGVGLGLIGNAIKASKEYGAELSRINQLGMSQADVASAVSAAWRTTYDVPTSRIAENLKTYREMRSLFGSKPEQEAEARMMLPMVQRLSGVMYAMTGKHQENIGFDLSKAAEMRTAGAMTPEALKRNVDLMSRTLIAMGGTLSVNDFHSTFKQAKMATMKWSDEFAYGLLPTLMQEMKSGPLGTSQSAGTAIMSLYRVIHGRMEKAAAPIWQDLGLLDPRNIVKNSTGVWQLKPGAIAGTEVFERNPLEWVSKFLAPNIERVAKAQHTSVEAVMDKMASNRNAGFALYTMYMKGKQFERDRDLINGAKNSEQAYQSLVRTNPYLAKEALSAQFDNAKVVFGYQLLPDLLKIMQMGVPILRDWTLWMREHPKLLGAAAKGSVVLFGFLAAVGTLANMASGFLALREVVGLFKKGKAVEEGAVVAARATPWLARAMSGIGGFVAGLGWWTVPIVAALAAVGGAIAFVAKGWDKSKGAWANIKAGLGDYWNWMVGLGRQALGVLRRLEEPKKADRWDDRAARRGLAFLDGFTSGAFKWMKEFGTGFAKLWSGIKTGLTSFVGFLKWVSEKTQKLLPFLFPKDGPKPGSSPGAGFPAPAKNWRDLGAYYGYQVPKALFSGMGAQRFVDAPGLPVDRKAVVPPPMKRNISTGGGDVYLDGRKVGQVLAPHFERAMEQASRSSGSSFDGRRSLAPVGLGVA